MQYWEDFRAKFGFNDGETIPAGADVIRATYCLVVNKILEKKDSKIRFLPMNVGTCHNGCRIVRVSLAFYEETLATENPFEPDEFGSYPDLGFPAIFEEADPDAAVDAALAEALILNIDDFLINSEVSLSKSFQILLNAIDNDTYKNVEINKTEPKELKKFGSVFWTIEDIKTRRPNWSDAHCESFLDFLEEEFREKMCEAGWAVINEELNDDTTEDDWNEDNSEGNNEIH